ncbi:DUF4232 domain-containing protein [Streptomyces sp. WMMB303]|uniref:DUF4232 domain-containing protein n=1 Tax=Streptomyces sp. WMMB303 TaxID=3034154 RepID=UPI0023EC9606|nr:DUF4232 domain-containing protein [Streptomyces sp. WMMB303]MDF4254403.1 DUF4232 domain-containing protein [Streptomyces sp. WMMB303]
MGSRFSFHTSRLVLAAAGAAVLAATGAATASAAAAPDGGARAEAGQQAGWGQACGTDDLNFTVSTETQAGGYYLVTAKAKPGITCYLEGTIPSASFGSAADTHASPAEQAVTDTVELSGSTAAYAGISPKSTNSNGGREFGQLILAVAGDEAHPVGFQLPETVEVDRPVTTNWHADPADAVPFAA